MPRSRSDTENENNDKELIVRWKNRLIINYNTTKAALTEITMTQT